MRSLRALSLAVVVLVLAASRPGPLLAQGAVPAPEEVLGFKVGADYHLATYTQAIQYFKVLASHSDRIKLFDMGRSSTGLTMTYAVISAPENLAALDRYKDIMRRLSLAQASPDEARGLAREGKAVIYIDGGLHASECAPAQHNIQLAYNLVTARDERSLRILRDVILVLVFPNPDGMNMLAEWYLPNVGTPYEISPMPHLFHKYAGHDNNRDSYIGALVETRNLNVLVNKEWFPVILYNHHQTAPFPARIWTPPNSEPTNPNVHPLIVRWQNLIGSAMGAAFDAEGKEGAISRILFDTWYPGYMTQVQDSHNIISILTETALYEYATPHFYTVQDFPQAYQDLTMSAFYPNPWKGGWWRIKDAVDYCLTASLAVLETGSKFREELLYNKYVMARDVMSRFTHEPPYAWIIPQRQRDLPSTVLLLERMSQLGIDIYRADEPFTSDGLTHPAGTYIVPLSQPFGLFFKNVFEEQHYPDLRKYPDLWQGIVQSKKFEAAPLESYDMMGWTLPYQFGLDAVAAQTPLSVRMSPVDKPAWPAVRVPDHPGYGYLIGHETNNSLAATSRLLKLGARVAWAKKGFPLRATEYPAGTIIVPAGAGVTPAVMNRIAADLGVTISPCPDKPKVETLDLRAPRLGVYQSWVPSEDEGWSRLILEQYEIPYTTLHDADIRAGNLRSNYDVILLPDAWSVELLTQGFPTGMMPPSFAGGLTVNGVRNLKTFAEEGGTLIFLNSVSNLALEAFGLPVRNVLKNVKREEFVCDGSLLRLNFDVSQPIAYGLPAEAAGVFSNSCAFEVMPSFEAKKETRSVAKYAGEALLMSGYIYGEKLIQNKSAVLDVPLGQGRVILLGFPVQFRAQPYGTFKLLLNAVFYGAAKVARPGRAIPPGVEGPSGATPGAA
jgi:hypothetical protein